MDDSKVKCFDFQVCAVPIDIFSDLAQYVITEVSVKSPFLLVFIHFVPMFVLIPVWCCVISGLMPLLWSWWWRARWYPSQSDPPFLTDTTGCGSYPSHFPHSANIYANQPSDSGRRFHEPSFDQFELITTDPHSGRGKPGGVVRVRNTADHHHSLNPHLDKKMGDERFPHLFAILVACSTFIVTLLFTSGAFGHQLGKYHKLFTSISENIIWLKFT